MVEDAKMLAKRAKAEYAKMSGAFDSVNFNKLLNKSKNAGFRFTNDFMVAFKSNAWKMPKSIREMQNAVSFQRLVSKAKIAGKDVPRGMANGFISGKVKLAGGAKVLRNLVNNSFDFNKSGKLTYKGTQVPAKLAAGITSGKVPIKGAVTRMNALIQFKKSTQNASGEGRKIANALSKSIANGKISYKQALGQYNSVTSTASRKQVSCAKTGAAGSRASGLVRGSEYGAGYVSGIIGKIRAAASAGAALAHAANAATKDAQKSGSPSRIAKNRGKEWGSGYAIGIGASTRAVRKRAAKMVRAVKNIFTSNITTNIKRIKSKSKNMIGSVASGIKKRLSRQNFWSRSFTDTTAAELARFNKIIDFGTTKAIKLMTRRMNLWAKRLKKITKSKRIKAAISKVAELLKGNYSKTLKLESSRIISAAKTSLNKLAEAYQKKYSSIIEKRNAMMEQLRSYGTLITTDSYGFAALTDFTKLLRQQNHIKNMMQKLQKYGVSRNFIDQISGLSPDEQEKILQKLTGMTPASVKKFAKQFDAYWANAAKVSGNIYSPYIKTLNSEYNAQLKRTIGRLRQQFNAIGAQTGKGLVAGLNNKYTRKRLNSVSRGLASIIIKQLKKSLKIHSPSKVTGEIGENAGLSLVDSLAATAKKVTRTAQDIITIPKLAFADGFDASLSAAYDYKQYIVVQSDIYMDDRKVAESLAAPMETELSKRQVRSNRKRGKK